MPRLSTSHYPQFTITRLVVLCALLFIAALAMTEASARRSHAASHKRQTLTPNLTFEDRVAA